MITLVHYPTATGVQSIAGERFLDNVALEGPIPVMARDTLNAIRRNMSRRAVIAGVGRQDIWEYPETALREAVVNALVHRDRYPLHARLAAYRRNESAPIRRSHFILRGYLS